MGEDHDPADGPAWRGASPEGERSDALALRADLTPTRSLIGSRAAAERVDRSADGRRQVGEEITGQGGLLSQRTLRMVERTMEVELTDHLGYEARQEPPGGAGNTRNGSTPKTLITEHGPVRIETPRDAERFYLSRFDRVITMLLTRPFRERLKLPQLP